MHPHLFSASPGPFGFRLAVVQNVLIAGLLILVLRTPAFSQVQSPSESSQFEQAQLQALDRIRDAWHTFVSSSNRSSVAARPSITSEEALLAEPQRRSLALQAFEPIQNPEEIRSVEYYRLIRNRFSHIEVNSKRIENQRKKLRELLKITADHIPPKSYEALDYGDFAFFTRAVKSIAFQICSTAKPSDQVIAEMATRGDYAALKRYKFNAERYRNALRQKLLMDYGLDETEVQPILRLVVGS